MSERSDRESQQPEQEKAGAAEQESMSDSDIKGESRDKDETTGESEDAAISGEIERARSSGGALGASGNVEVPAEALRDAVGQLKKLLVLRQQEAERQEKVIGDMQAAMQRQGRTNGWMVFLSIVLLVAAGAGVYHFLQLRATNENVAGQVEELGGTLAVTRETIETATEQQRLNLADVSEKVNAEVGRQTALLAEMDGRVEATREAVTQEVGRQFETLTSLEQAVSATREEQAERLAAVESGIARTLNETGDEQAAALATVREAVEVARREQAERLALANEEVTRALAETASGQTVALVSVNDQVSALRENQTQELEALREQLAAARAENAELTVAMDEKIRAAENAIAARVDESVAAVKAERDQILTEMGRLLEERMSELDQREKTLERRQAALTAEEERFAQQAAASRERMRALLNDALQTLTPGPGIAPEAPLDSAPPDPVSSPGPTSSETE